MGNESFKTCFGLRSHRPNPADYPQTARQQSLSTRYRQQHQQQQVLPPTAMGNTTSSSPSAPSESSVPVSGSAPRGTEASPSPSVPLLPAIILPDGLPVLSDPTAYDNYNQKSYHFEYFFGSSNTTQSEKNTLFLKGYPQLRRPARLLLLEALRSPHPCSSASGTSHSSSSSSSSTTTSPHASTYPLLAKLLETIPSLSLTTHWCLVYSSLAHGQNLTRLLKAATAIKGPSLLIVKERCADAGSGANGSGHRGGDSDEHQDEEGEDNNNEGGAAEVLKVAGRTFGGYADTRWTTVADRQMEDKRNAAAHRRESHGIGSGSSSVKRSEGPHQAGQFFGGPECFVFTTGDAVAGDAADSIRIYKSKYNGNANYLYCWDKHPDKARIGIGFGSTEKNNVGEFALFLDRYLSQGASSLHLCPTYGSPRLSSSSQFKIFAVELYALDCSSCFPPPSEASATRMTYTGSGSHATESNNSNNKSRTAATFTEYSNFVNVSEAVDLEKMLGRGWDMDIEYDKFGNPILPDGGSILDREQDMAMMRFAGKEFATDETRDACWAE